MDKHLDLSDYEFEQNVSRAATLPSRWYLDREFLKAEQKQIFAKTWQLACRTEQLAEPGNYVAIEVAGEPLVLVRGRERIEAMSNVCRHRASPIASGSGNAKTLNCPYHGWTYSLEGKLLGAREMDGIENWKREDICLPRFRTATWGPMVFVNLDSEAPPLEDYIGAIDKEVASHGHDLGQFRFALRKAYRMRCNWKVYIDNYQEGYHIPIVHPALFKELDYAKYRVDCFEHHSFHYAPIRQLSPDDPRAQTRRYATDETAKQTLYYWIFPNLMINIYPDNMSTNLVIPVDENTTDVVFEWFVTEELFARGPKWIEEMAAFSDGVQDEDGAICEAVQKGLNSATYDRGRFSPLRENGVHFFHKLVREYLVGD